MKFEFIGNACGIFHGSKGTKLLCDPWIVSGVCEGSWFHYPALETTLDDVLDVDIVYVSHIHQDHYDERYFNFRKDIPIIVLDMGNKYNFLIRNLERSGFTNLIRIKDNETKDVEEFKITLYAPFEKDNFNEARIGNIIDSAMVVQDKDIVAVNFNDNKPSVKSCSMLKEKFKKIDLAMVDYNGAGVYPSCFQNLTNDEKMKEKDVNMLRAYNHMVSVVNELQPLYVLPFAGAYVLGGKQSYKNKYLGASWDVCKEYISDKVDKSIDIICLRDKDIFDLTTGQSNNEYVPINEKRMKNYIENELSQLKYPYEYDDEPNMDVLLQDIGKASIAMKKRMSKYGIKINTTLALSIDGREVVFYNPSVSYQKLVCKLDDKLLRRIMDHNIHWNNAEGGCHIDFIRDPNIYEHDVHTALQFFSL